MKIKKNTFWGKLFILVFGFVLAAGGKLVYSKKNNEAFATSSILSYSVLENDWKSSLPYSDLGITDFSEITKVSILKGTEVNSSYTKHSTVTFGADDNIFLYYNSSDPTDIILVSSKYIAVTDASSLFEGGSSITYINLDNLKTNYNAYNDYCDELNDIQYDNPSTYLSNARYIEITNILESLKVKNVSNMFKGCSSLTEIYKFGYLDLQNVTNASGMFEGCSSLSNLSLPNLAEYKMTRVTNISRMFYGCSSFVNLDLTNWLDVSNITSTQTSVFDNCDKLYSLTLPTWSDGFTGAIELPNTSSKKLYIIDNDEDDPIFNQVTSATAANCSSGQTLKAGETLLNTPNASMSSLTNYNFALAVSVGSNQMPSKITSIKFAADVPEGYVSAYGADPYNKLFYSAIDDKLLEGIRVYVNNSNKTEIALVSSSPIYLPADSSYLFKFFTSLKSIDFSNANADLVTNIDNIFKVYDDNNNNGTNLIYVDMSALDFSSLTSANNVFSTATAATNLFFAPKNLPTGISITLINGLYSSTGVKTTTINSTNCSTDLVTQKFTKELILPSNWKTEFETATGVAARTISSLQIVNTIPEGYTLLSGTVMASCQSVKIYNNGLKYAFVCDDPIYAPVDASRLFQMCEPSENCALASLDLTNFKTSNTTNMSYMFYCCTNLTRLNLYYFDTSNVTDMSYMFAGFENDFYNREMNLTDLYVGNWNTSNVTTMENMFYKCNVIKTLNLGNFDCTNVSNFNGFVSTCNSLAKFVSPKNVNTTITFPKELFKVVDEGDYISTLNINNTTTSNTYLARFTLTYVLGDGANWKQGYIAPTGYYYSIETKLPVAANLYKTHYKFNGWTNKDAEIDQTWNSPTYNPKLYTNSTTACISVTLYAHWKEKDTVSITEDAQSYACGTENIAFKIQGTTLTDFNVYYYVDGGWTTTVPANVGTYNVKVTRDEDDDYKSFSKELSEKLVITKANRTITATGGNIAYTGTAVQKPTYTVAGGGTETILYKTATADDSEYSAIAPIIVGDYKAKIIIGEDENYNETELVVDFSITKANATISSLVANNIGCGEKLTITTQVNVGSPVYYYRLYGSTTWLELTQNTIFETRGAYEIKAEIASDSNINGTSKTSTFNVDEKKLESKQVESNSKPQEGTKVDLLEGSLETDSVVVISKDNSAKNNILVQNVKNAVNEKSEIIAKFEIHIEDSNGNVETVSGNKYRVTLVLDKSLVGRENYEIVYIDDENNVIKYASTMLDDKTIVFETDHFSTWAIVADEKPQSMIWIFYVAGAVLIIAAILVLLLTKRKIRFVVNEKEIENLKLRPYKKIIFDDKVSHYEWFLDKELTKPFARQKMGLNSFVLYGKSSKIKKEKM